MKTNHLLHTHSPRSERMKSMMTSTSALFLLLFSGTPLTSSTLVSLPSVGTPYDYIAILSGSDECLLISIVMDESGTMRLEQEFMFTRAMPDLVERLKLTFDLVTFSFALTALALHLATAILVTFTVVTMG
jgi:hypothetical protein